MEQKEKDNVVGLHKVPAVDRPVPEFTDKLLHGQVRDTIRVNGELGKMKEQINELFNKAQTARLMGNGDYLMRNAAIQASSLTSECIRTSLEQMIENQMVIMHALQQLLYPGSLRILLEHAPNPKAVPANNPSTKES